MMKFGNMFNAGILREKAERSGGWSSAWDGSYSKRDGFVQSTGITVGTQIATQMGWRSVETLQINDQVLTFDNGLQKITRIERTELIADLDAPQHHWPLHVPVGAIGNSVEMTLLPEQIVMIESDLAEQIYNDPFISMPAAALHGYNGIERKVARKPIEIFVLYFENDEVIFVYDGALIHCASETSITVSGLLETEQKYDVMSMEQARAFVNKMSQAPMEDAASSETQNVTWMTPHAMQTPVQVAVPLAA